MGMFYVSIAVHTADRSQVMAALARLKRTAYVLPPKRGYFVIYDRECDEQDTDVIARLTTALSRTFLCSAVATLVHDDDAFWYQVYAAGALRDQYNSMPHLFDPPGSSDGPGIPEGGDAALLCALFDRPRNVARVERILRHAHYTFESERHLALARALGWPTVTAQLPFQDLTEAMEEESRHAEPVQAAPARVVRQALGTGDYGPAFDLDRELRKLLRRGRKISAIVLCQQHKQCKLEEARRYVESL